MSVLATTRRSFLRGGGALVVSFSIYGMAQAQQEGEAEGAELPGSLDDARMLDSWIRVDPDGTVTVFTGKAELGQGIRTALLQVAAEELHMAPETLVMITADTGRTPDEGYTAGSNSMANGGTALRHAAAQVRDILIAEAATRWQVAPDTLRAEDGRVVGPDGQQAGFGDLVTEQLLAVEAQPESRLTPTDQFRYMGRSVPRADIPAKVTGAPAYVHDIRLPGMLHARVIRPPAPGCTLQSLDSAAVEALPDVVAVVRDGSFLAVVATREFEAIRAMRMLAAAAEWSEATPFPDPATLHQTLRDLSDQSASVARRGDTGPVAAQDFQATFTRDYQMHGSIGPSCAVAIAEDDTLTVWSHTQGVFPDREAIAEMLGMDLDAVRVIHAEGAGCYGHNGADDAAADAALIARALPGRPIRLQWTREQEHEWEPYGPAMTMDLRATLASDGSIARWTHHLWSNTHTNRPGPAGSLLAARSMAQPFAPEVPEQSITANGNGDRNAVPLYSVPNLNVRWHFIEDMPLRVSALRALGAYANVFAIESMMDDLAAASDQDPVAFRLRHLQDERARDVVIMAADRFGWSQDPLPPDRGRGFAFAQYKNLAAYLALAVEVQVERESGRVQILRAVSAIDSGEVVSPDGIRNQTEGGLIQAFSWSLFESVQFDQSRITSVDWSSYPIMRFAGLPASINVHIVDRPGQPFLGTGEAAQGPAAAALGNAIFDATGARMRHLPMTRDRIKAAIGA